nr:major head subunit protein [uncultured bacterium]
MLINSGNLAILFRAFNTAFQKGFSGTPSQWAKIATLVPSSTGTEDYGWLGSIPGMREWLGDRQIQNLALSSYSIKNKEFESTIGVKRSNVEDDQYGIYAPMFEMLGQNASEHPDTLIFALLAAGFATNCYDGQYFFDTDHPVIQADGSVASVSNLQAGAGNPWFLLDTRRPLKPLIYQERKKAQFVAMDKETDTNVFTRAEYLYGVDSRCNVGFGFWQMAFGSKDTLDAANFEAAYDAMGAVTGDSGKKLGVKPSILVVGPSNASAGRKIIQAQLINGGDSNTNFNRVELLECPWLA